MNASEGGRADAAQSDDAAAGYPPARRRARADPAQSQRSSSTSLSRGRHSSRSRSRQSPSNASARSCCSRARRMVPAARTGKRPRREYETSVGSRRDRQRNALIVSMLAYAGLRPIEDRGCTWGDLRDHTLHVFATKTGRARDVDLIAPLAQDLAEWRIGMRPSCGQDELIIPRPSGGQWTREDWANWRRRVWRPAAIEAGVTGDLRPYRLRGSFVSLLLWEGRSLTYVAEQAGHSSRDPRAALRRDDARARNEAPRPRRRGHRPSPRGSLRDALRTHP